jgi:hypothetical protein
MSAADAIDAKPKKTPAANAVRRKRFMLAPKKSKTLQRQSIEIAIATQQTTCPQNIVGELRIFGKARLDKSS